MPTQLSDWLLWEDWPVWDRVFTVNPLVLIGTRERDGEYDLAPKHMALPMGWENYFGFVCTPRHGTYHNARREGAFTVSYPKPTQIVLASLSATRRDGDGSKPSLYALPTFPACEVDGVFIQDAYLFLECVLDRIVDDFGENSLISGRVVAAHVSEDYLRILLQSESEVGQDSFGNLSPLYSPLCVEGKFSELRVDGVLRSSAHGGGPGLILQAPAWLMRIDRSRR